MIDFITEHHLKQLTENYLGTGNKNVNQQRQELKTSLKRKKTDLKRSRWLKKQIKSHQIHVM